MRMLLLLLLLVPNWLATPQNVQSYFVSKETVACMAENLHHEARGEPQKGQISVIHVVRNRIGKKNWGNTVCKVVYKPYQFSWTIKAGKPGRSQKAQADTKLLALQAVAAPETLGEDPTGGALWYHSVRIRKPLWTKNLHASATIGQHVFYTEREK